MFQTNQIGKLTFLTAENIPVPHCFTTRLGGVSQGHLAQLNLGTHRGDNPKHVIENYTRLGAAVGFSPADLVLTHQTHTDCVLAVDASDKGAGLFQAELPPCDGLVTNTPGVGLVAFAADCTPILLHDPVTGAVGAVHAGWRGTAADIAGVAVRTMVAAYGADPKHIRAAIGPHIGACCFETQADVPQAMKACYGEAAAEFIRPQGQKYYVNLTGLNTLSLRRAGVVHVDCSDLCTACDDRLFWSARKLGDRRGCQGAVIICKEVCA